MNLSSWFHNELIPFFILLFFKSYNLKIPPQPQPTRLLLVSYVLYIYSVKSEFKVLEKHQQSNKSLNFHMPLIYTENEMTLFEFALQINLSDTFMPTR